MNKIVIIAVFIFWAAVSFFYANNLINGNSGQIANTQNTNNSGNANTQLSSFGTDLPSHNTKNDCWLGINGKVYDVTGYIYSHPGGANEIIKYCGQDATKAFSSKDKLIPQNHSQAAYDMLADYYIGDMRVSASAVDNQNQDQTSTGGNQGSNNTTSPQPVSYTLTAALVAQHNTASDCWVMDANQVFNVTSYIRSHPGGQSAITSYCGTDIGAAFRAQGHSANAASIFAGMQIGTIGGTVTSEVTTVTPPANTNTGRGDDDDDDEWDD